MALYTSRDAFLESGLAPVALTSDDDCLICLEKFSNPDCNDTESKSSLCDAGSAECEGHSAVKIEGCSHVYGSDCIRTWVETGNTCPLCRKVLFPKPNSSLRHIRPDSSSVFNVAWYRYQAEGIEIRHELRALRARSQEQDQQRAEETSDRPSSYASDRFRGTGLYDDARRREQDVWTIASPYSPLSRTHWVTHRIQEPLISRFAYRRRDMTRFFSRRNRARYHNSDADSILSESYNNIESVRAEAGSVIDTGYADDARSIDFNRSVFGDGTSDAEQTRDDALSNVADAGDEQSDQDSDDEEVSDDEDEDYIDARERIFRLWRIFHRVD